MRKCYHNQMSSLTNVTSSRPTPDSHGTLQPPFNIQCASLVNPNNKGYPPEILPTKYGEEVIKV